MQLLIATKNKGKKAEYSRIFGALDVELLLPTDRGLDIDVAETGTTYAENALLKARSYSQAAGLLTLADDSGLEVDALGGAPGIYSARYAGEGATDEERYRLLLENLADVPDEQRGARFRCVIALVWPDGRASTVEGTCEGWITRQPRGENGFGYDPVFQVAQHGRTMAELPPDIKNKISHRARAAEQAREILLTLLQECSR